jgi:hypothetical protein
MSIDGENDWGRVQIFALVRRASIISRTAIRGHSIAFIGPDIAISCANGSCAGIAC